MAKHLEKYIAGRAQYIITCARRGCSWSVYDVVNETCAKYYDDAHFMWHVDQNEAEAARMKRNDESC